MGLRFCARAFSSCGERGPLFIAVRGPLTIAASLVAEHRLQTRRLSSCGSRAQSLRGMWDPPGPGLEPVSPASAGRLSTTAPPGKPWLFFNWAFYFLTVEFEFFAYFGYHSFTRYMFCKYFPPVCGLSFIFLIFILLKVFVFFKNIHGDFHMLYSWVHKLFPLSPCNWEHIFEM